MTHLLPANASEFERAFSLATDEAARVSPGIGRLRTAKRVSIPDTFLPYLIYEYGLGEVSPFVEDQRRLLVTGIDWQRVRGTPEAINFALDWLGNSASLEEAPSARRRWNTFQLALNLIPQTDTALDRIEAVVNLSVPVRSRFWRGFRGYDVREAEWSRRKWSGMRWSASSGARLRPDGTKWSFGVTHDYETNVGQTDLERLGAWLPLEDLSTDWLGIEWDDTESSWVNADNQARTNAICEMLVGRSVFLKLRDASGDVVGYRRARAIHPVAPALYGIYQVGPLRLSPDKIAPTGLYVEAMTEFGDGAGRTATTATLVWDGYVTDGYRPAALWLEPGELLGYREGPTVDLEASLTRTKRHRARFLLTF